MGLLICLLSYCHQFCSLNLFLSLPSVSIPSSPFSPFMTSTGLVSKSVSNVGNPNFKGVEFPTYPSQELKGASFHRSPPNSCTETRSPVRGQPLEPLPSSVEGFHIKGLPPNNMARVQSVLAIKNIQMVKCSENNFLRQIAGHVIWVRFILWGSSDLYKEFWVIPRFWF